MKQRLIRVDAPENLRHELYGRTVAFHVRPEDTQFTSLIGDLPFARNVQLVPLSNGASAALVVDVDDPLKQNPIIVRMLVEAGAEVQFVGELRHSLEDVYLTLINA